MNRIRKLNSPNRLVRSEVLRWDPDQPGYIFGLSAHWRGTRERFTAQQFDLDITLRNGYYRFTLRTFFEHEDRVEWSMGSETIFEVGAMIARRLPYFPGENV